MPGQPAATPKVKKAKSPGWAKALLAFGVVLALLSVSGLVGSRYFLGKLTDNIQTTSSVLDDSTGGVASGKLPDGAMNLLMLGLDTRQGWEEKGETSRSDTM